MLLDYQNSQFRFYPDIFPAEEVKMVGGKINTALKCYIFPPIRVSYYTLCRLYGTTVLSMTPSAFDCMSNDTIYADLPEEIQNYKPLPHQVEAIKFLVNNPLPGKLLSLAQGLGKTFVSIVAAKLLGFKNILVICPLTLIRTWQEEIQKWTGEEARIAHGCAVYGPEAWLITNYDSVVNHIDTYKEWEWDLVICDESILLKTRGKIQAGKVKGTKRVATIKTLTDRVPNRWLLSGSPVSKYADDLYSQLNILYPSYFTSYWRFANEYCYLTQTNWGTSVTGTKRNINFRQEFSDIIYRMNKEEAGLNLPDMLFETYTVDLNPDQKKVYDELEKEFIATLDNEEISVTTKLALMIRLQQIVSNLNNLGENWKTSSSKLDLLLDLIANGEIETPCIIWTNWIKTGQAIADSLDRLTNGSIEFVHGNVPVDTRNNYIQSFKDGKIKFLVISLGTGKFGLTLTNSKTMIYYDKTYDGDAYVQSQERIHRIGLEHQPTVISLVANGTIDELINKNLLNKAMSMSKINGSEMKALFASLTRK
jgi:SNF2 family DNA or RNA helicase